MMKKKNKISLNKYVVNIKCLYKWFSSDSNNITPNYMHSCSIKYFLHLIFTSYYKLVFKLFLSFHVHFIILFHIKERVKSDIN